MKKLTLMMIGLVALTSYQPSARAEMSQGDKDLLNLAVPCAAGAAVYTGANYIAMKKGHLPSGGEVVVGLGASCMIGEFAAAIGEGYYYQQNSTPDEKALNEQDDSQE